MHMPNSTINTTRSLSLQDIYFCAHEIQLQRDTPDHVYYMALALAFTRDYIDTIQSITQRVLITDSLVKQIASICYGENLDYRTVPVLIGGKIIPPTHIDRQMTNLLDAQEYLTDVEFYREFEEIHPFVDCNGRTGAILYNIHHINDLQLPPDLWG